MSDKAMEAGIRAYATSMGEDFGLPTEKHGTTAQERKALGAFISAYESEGRCQSPPPVEVARLMPEEIDMIERRWVESFDIAEMYAHSRSDIPTLLAHIRAPAALSEPDAGLVERVRRTTEMMANHCSVEMTLWNEHSNAALNAAARLTELAARADNWRGCFEQMQARRIETQRRLDLAESCATTAYSKGLEDAIKVSAQVIFDARTGEIDTDLRSIGHVLESRLRALKPAEGK